MDFVESIQSEGVELERKPMGEGTGPKTDLFNLTVDIDDLNTLRNLSELEASKTIIETFKKMINELTVLDKELPSAPLNSLSAISALCFIVCFCQKPYSDFPSRAAFNKSPRFVPKASLSL